MSMFVTLPLCLWTYRNQPKRDVRHAFVLTEFNISLTVLVRFTLDMRIMLMLWRCLWLCHFACKYGSLAILWSEESHAYCSCHAKLVNSLVIFVANPLMVVLKRGLLSTSKLHVLCNLCSRFFSEGAAAGILYFFQTSKTIFRSFRSFQLLLYFFFFYRRALLPFKTRSFQLPLQTHFRDE